MPVTVHSEQKLVTVWCFVGLQMQITGNRPILNMQEVVLRTESWARSHSLSSQEKLLCSEMLSSASGLDGNIKLGPGSGDGSEEFCVDQLPEYETKSDVPGTVSAIIICN